MEYAKHKCADGNIPPMLYLTKKDGDMLVGGYQGPPVYPGFCGTGYYTVVSSQGRENLTVTPLFYCPWCGIKLIGLDKEKKNG